MREMVYYVSWLEWSSPEGGREVPKVRRRALFKSAEGRAEFLEKEKEKDTFLYVLSEWEEPLQ